MENAFCSNSESCSQSVVGGSPLRFSWRKQRGGSMSFHFFSLFSWITLIHLWSPSYLSKQINEITKQKQQILFWSILLESWRWCTSCCRWRFRFIPKGSRFTNSILWKLRKLYPKPFFLDSKLDVNRIYSSRGKKLNLPATTSASEQNVMLVTRYAETTPQKFLFCQYNV